MQFIKNGPDIPDALLRAHEDGKVVFFCGAGISYAAGLPSFKGLVDQLYEALNTTPEPLEQRPYKNNQFDATLDLLERRYPGGRLALRSKLGKILTPKLLRKNATASHLALLDLSRDRKGALRLVTTNFDRIFERVCKKHKMLATPYSAPLLPIPKKSRWNGIAYLHGLLPLAEDEATLNRLVLTSGDFGLAYLVERWASRFVSDLFKNYVVCFVGYSLDDPVLRYMMDALAADRFLGEAKPDAYAFGDARSTEEVDRRIEWEAKGVVPILYNVSDDGRDYSMLQRTLTTWAATYRDGALGKQRIVLENAIVRPLLSTEQDNYVGRMLWALSDDSGIPAQSFAEFKPTPSLEWLQPLSDERFSIDDFLLSHVTGKLDGDRGQKFSLLNRPTSSDLAIGLALRRSGYSGSPFDKITPHLFNWLTKHLDDPDLPLWLAERPLRLTTQLRAQIDWQLKDQQNAQQQGHAEKLAQLREDSPRGIAGIVMRQFWQLLLSGRIKDRSSRHETSLYAWLARFSAEGMSASNRRELKELLTPKISVNRSYAWVQEKRSAENPRRLRDLVNWELVLAGDYVRHIFHNELQSERWRAELPGLFLDLQSLLIEALDLVRELGEADDLTEMSSLSLPSISPHWQNRDFPDWPALVELLRDSWVETWKTSAQKARTLVDVWLYQPHPTFKRLVLFASTYEGVCSKKELVSWLVRDDGWWLWSSETQREVMEAFKVIGQTAPSSESTRLIDLLLIGPPREMFRTDLQPDLWEQIKDEMIWLRLSKLEVAGMRLKRREMKALQKIRDRHPQFQLASDESDEFSHWMSGSGDPGFRFHTATEIAPKELPALMRWLMDNPPPQKEDNWRSVCNDDFRLAARALSHLAKDDKWPVSRWRDALQVWSSEANIKKSWRLLAPIVVKMPQAVVEENAHAMFWWFNSASKSMNWHRDVFLHSVPKFLKVDFDGIDSGSDIMMQAINHPVGLLTQAVLNVWFSRPLNDNEKLSPQISAIFSSLSDRNIDKYEAGRVLLATNVLALFRVDYEWTLSCLLPLFIWTISPRQARAAWASYLWSPRLYRPLMVAWKTDFLETGEHFSELGEQRRQYAALFTFAALDPGDTFSTEELQRTLAILPEDGLEDIILNLTRALSGTDEQRKEQWDNRISKFWRELWPKNVQFRSQKVVTGLAQLLVATGDAFADAFSTLRNWLQTIENPDFTVGRLSETNLCMTFPGEALDLLNLIVGDPPYVPGCLLPCLIAIAEAWPKAREDARFKRLKQIAKRPF